MSLYTTKEINLNQCNIKWKILEIKKSVGDEECSFNLFMKIQDENSNIYFIKWNELIDLWEYWTSCIWWFTNYPVFLNWNEYYPKVWDFLNLLVDNLNNTIVKTSFNDSDNYCISNNNEDEFLNYESLSEIEIFNLKQKIIDKIVVQDLADNEIINNLENDIKKEETIKTIVIDKKEINYLPKEDTNISDLNNNYVQELEIEDYYFEESNIDTSQIIYENDTIYENNNKDYFIIWTWIISLIILWIILYKKLKK